MLSCCRCIIRAIPSSNGPSHAATLSSDPTNISHLLSHVLLLLCRFSHLYFLSLTVSLHLPSTSTVQEASPSSLSSRISIARHVSDNPSLLYPKPLSSPLPPHRLDTTIITQYLRAQNVETSRCLSFPPLSLHLSSLLTVILLPPLFFLAHSSSPPLPPACLLGVSVFKLYNPHHSLAPSHVFSP